MKIELGIPELLTGMTGQIAGTEDGTERVFSEYLSSEKPAGQTTEDNSSDSQMSVFSGHDMSLCYVNTMIAMQTGVLDSALDNPLDPGDLPDVDALTDENKIFITLPASVQSTRSQAVPAEANDEPGARLSGMDSEISYSPDAVKPSEAEPVVLPVTIESVRQKDTGSAVINSPLTVFAIQTQSTPSRASQSVASERPADIKPVPIQKDAGISEATLPPVELALSRPQQLLTGTVSAQQAQSTPSRASQSVASELVANIQSASSQRDALIPDATLVSIVSSTSPNVLTGMKARPAMPSLNENSSQSESLQIVLPQPVLPAARIDTGIVDDLLPALSRDVIDVKNASSTNTETENLLLPERVNEFLSVDNRPALAQDKLSESMKTCDTTVNAMTDFFNKKLAAPETPAIKNTDLAGAHSKLDNAAPLLSFKYNPGSLTSSLKVDGYTARIKVYPGDLGQITAEIMVNKGMTELKLTTESLQVKHFIEAHLQPLRESFQGMNIQLGQVHVQNNSSQDRQEQTPRQGGESGYAEYQNDNPRESSAQSTQHQSKSLVDTYA